MNDFSELEDQLRKLRPATPSPELFKQVERGLAEPDGSTLTAGVLPRSRRLHFNWLSLGLGLAAATALVLFALVRLQQPTTSTSKVASVSPVADDCDFNGAICSRGFDPGCLPYSRRRAPLSE